MPQAVAYAIDSPTGVFSRTTVERREPGPTEVLIDIAYAGICHSDIHTARNEWGGKVNYPLVPGHEIAGVVSAVGSQVTKFAVGDRVGVGCFVDSCRECDNCRAGEEQFCDGPGGTVMTYNSLGRDGVVTQGGYSTAITVEQDYVCGIPEGIGLDEAAPLLCAGITMYSPLKRWGAGPGTRVAIVGMGGLGHMGVQLAAAMGAEVAVISQTRSKEADGRRFGATEYHATSEEGTLKALRGSFDLIISTVSGDLDLAGLLWCLKVGGTLVDVGLPEHPVELNLRPLVMGRRNLAGSLIGGIPETQEMLDFCAEHGIGAEVEVIGGEDITAAYDKVVASKVRYRYVIDTATFTA
ncbi:MAG: NAD(P)-dependent alcohol dehydrogenase [Propionibacteriales bacterium]|nr:NAD(P)-dependent alcohol dehydrogenase [Propionibacteriales bacterium]